MLATPIYMLSLGDIEKGSVSRAENHAVLRDFPTETEMRTHWKECHVIEMHEVVKPYKVQDNTTEPAPKLRLPELGTRPNQVSRRMSKELAKKLSKQVTELPGSSKSDTCVTIDSQDEHDENVD